MCSLGWWETGANEWMCVLVCSFLPHKLDQMAWEGARLRGRMFPTWTWITQTISPPHCGFFFLTPLESRHLYQDPGSVAWPRESCCREWNEFDMALVTKSRRHEMFLNNLLIIRSQPNECEALGLVPVWCLRRDAHISSLSPFMTAENQPRALKVQRRPVGIALTDVWGN